MSNTSITSGVHHVGLTVPNLSECLGFFIDILEYNLVGEKPDYPAAFISDGTTIITLWQAANPATATDFNRNNVIGLHHLALTVDGDAGLDALYEKLKSVDNVEIEFAPEILGEGPTRHMMCIIPSGIRVEFISPAT